MGGSQKHATFKRKHTKVGHQPAKPSNYTDTSVSFKRINMIQQSITVDKSKEVYLSARHQTVGTLISQMKNCSALTRREAVLALYGLCKQHGERFAYDKGVEVADICLNGILDSDAKVRKTAGDILLLITSLSQCVISALGRVFSLKLELALGSLDDNIVIDALRLIQAPITRGLDDSVLRLFPSLLRKPALLDATTTALRSYLIDIQLTKSDISKLSPWIALADIWTDELHNAGSIDIRSNTLIESLVLCVDALLDALLDIGEDYNFSCQSDETKKHALKYFSILYTLYHILKLIPPSINSNKGIIGRVIRFLSVFPVSVVSFTDITATSLAQLFNLLLIYIAIHFGLFKSLFQTDSRRHQTLTKETSFTSLASCISNSQLTDEQESHNLVLNLKEQMDTWTSTLIDMSSNISDSLSHLESHIGGHLSVSLSYIYIDFTCAVCRFLQSSGFSCLSVLRELLLLAPISCRRKIIINCLDYTQTTMESTPLNSLNTLPAEIDHLITLAIQELCRRPAHGTELWKHTYKLILQRLRIGVPLSKQLITTLHTFLQVEINGKIISTAAIIEHSYDPHCKERVLNLLTSP